MTTTIISCTCPDCQTVQNVVVPTKGHADWLAGELIQIAMPGLSADEAEALKTGICATCWDARFDYENEDDGQPTEYDEWQDYMGGDDDWRDYDSGGDW